MQDWVFRLGWSMWVFAPSNSRLFILLLEKGINFHVDIYQAHVIFEFKCMFWSIRFNYLKDSSWFDNYNDFALILPPIDTYSIAAKQCGMRMLKRQTCISMQDRIKSYLFQLHSAPNPASWPAKWEGRGAIVPLYFGWILSNNTDKNILEDSY